MTGTAIPANAGLGVESGPAPGSDSPIFILGMPRSGTTLVRSILSAHPGIIVAPELHYFRIIWPYRHADLSRPETFERFWDLFVAEKRFRNLMVEPERVRARIAAAGRADFRTVLDATMQEFATLHGRRRWGEKTPRNHAHVPTLLEWFPDARVIFLQRDPRATIASVRKTPWGRRAPIEAWAREWAQAARAAERWRDDPRVLTLRYEDLVLDPEARVRALCVFLGEDFLPEMLTERGGSIVQAEPIGWAREALTAATRPIHADSLERWRGELSTGEIDLIDALTARAARRAGYLAETPGAWRRHPGAVVTAEAARLGQNFRAGAERVATRLGLLRPLCSWRLRRGSP